MPAVDTNMIVEYTHRVLAASVAILIAYLAWTAWRHRRSERLLVRVSFATFGLILVQAALGGLTVEEGLKQELVATHLGVAMLQIALVLMMGRLGGPDAPPALRPGATRAIRALTALALVAVLGTIVAGRLHVGERAARHRRRAPLGRRPHGLRRGVPGLRRGVPALRPQRGPRHPPHPPRFMYVAVLVLLALFVTVVRQRRRLEESPGADLADLAWVTIVVLPRRCCWAP